MATVVHFSDGEKAICGLAKENTAAVFDIAGVTCKKCLKMLEDRAKVNEDPLIWAQILNRDIKEGMDWAFSYEGRTYHIVNNDKVRLPESVVKHLETRVVPQKKYVPNAEAGQSIVSAGIRHRFIVTRMAS